MEKSILNFPKQFTWKPKVENSANLKKAGNIIVAGMGGSAFPVGILKIAHLKLDISNHRDYNLPPIPHTPHPKPLIICCSYSGNTEETISSFEEARKKKIPVAVLTVGGKLSELAKKHKVPYVKIPDTHIQPRAATGFVVNGLSKLIGLKNEKNFTALSKVLKPEKWQLVGKALAENLWDQIPVIYASDKNADLARIWKIKFNENTKIPAFWNFLPEMNHNEMTGYDVIKTTAKLSDNLHLIFLEDTSDHPRIKRRFAVTQKLLAEKGINISQIPLSGKNVWEKIFNSILLADWTSFHLAKYYGVDPENVPMVEQFKKLIK